MWLGEVSRDDLNKAGRWTVAFFSEAKTSQVSAYETRVLRSVLTERRRSVDPQAMGSTIINYLGLENVRSNTGELVDFHPRLATDVKSRSKTFDVGDVLFGRLRPELNKVYLAETHVSPGICSNEFIVLTPGPDLSPRYLRYALASGYVTQFAGKLRSGASLPRISTADLLDLRIPVPPLDRQKDIEQALTSLDESLRRIRSTIEWLPNAIAESFNGSLQSGINDLPNVERDLAQRSKEVAIVRTA